MSSLNHENDPTRLRADMDALESQLAAMMNDWAEAAADMARLLSAIERLKAPRRLELKRNPPVGIPKPTKEDLDALLLEWLWDTQDQLMTRQLEAEALCVAFDTKYRVASKVLSSKQTRLNADMKLFGTGR